MSHRSTLVKLSAVSRRFTLVELLVVIAIIALLASLLLPGLQAARFRAMDIVCVSQLRQLGIGANTYAGDFDDYFPQRYSNGKLFDGTNTFWGWNHNVPGPNWIWYTWGMMSAVYDYIPNRNILVCPTYQADPTSDLPLNARAMREKLENPSHRTYTSYSIWGLSCHPNDVTHLCRMSELEERQPGPIGDILAHSGYWLSSAGPPRWWTHRLERVQVWWFDGSVRPVKLSTLRTNAPFGGMNSLNNTYAWTDGTVPSEGYNGGPAIAYWERLWRLYHEGE